MAKYSRKDQEILMEAYNVTLLRESVPGMTLKQVKNNMDLMSESELEYVNGVLEKMNTFIVQEGILGNAWSGVKNLAGAGKSAASSAAQGIASKVAQGAKQLGAGAVAAGKQIGSNVSDMYKTGAQANRSSDALVKADQLSQQLIDLLIQAQDAGLIQKQGDIVDMTLSDIANELATAKQSADTFRGDSRKQGFTGGVKQAFTQGAAQAVQPTA